MAGEGEEEKRFLWEKQQQQGHIWWKEEEKIGKGFSCSVPKKVLKIIFILPLSNLSQKDNFFLLPQKILGIFFCKSDWINLSFLGEGGEEEGEEEKEKEEEEKEEEEEEEEEGGRKTRRRKR